MNPELEEFRSAFLRRGIIPKMISNTSSSTSIPHLGAPVEWVKCLQAAFTCLPVYSAFIFDESVINYFTYGEPQNCIRIGDLNDGFLIVDIPFTRSDSVADTSHHMELVGNLSDGILVSCDLSAPEFTEASSLKNFSLPLDFNDAIDFSKSLLELQSLTEQMKKATPLTRSSDLLDMAKRAVAAMSERTAEDIDEWARKLAGDIKDAAD